MAIRNGDGACGNCRTICSHAAIRMKVYPAAALAGAPETFKSVDAGKLTSKFGEKVTIQVAPETRHRRGCLRIASRSAFGRPSLRKPLARLSSAHSGGLDHVLASGKNIKILVMDTEVYSNTGGQASKATPTGAIAKFAASGKAQPKKNLGLMQMQYKNVYVAYVSMGTNPAATVKAFNEAENYNGPAIIIAYARTRLRALRVAFGDVPFEAELLRCICIEQGLLTKTGPYPPSRRRASRSEVATGVRTRRRRWSPSTSRSGRTTRRRAR